MRCPRFQEFPDLTAFSFTALIAPNRNMCTCKGIAANNDPQILAVKVTDELITAELSDGRTISVPVAWSWRLSNATSQQRDRFEIIGSGEGIHWPEVDEDISVHGMLCGTPARPQTKAVSNP